MTRLGEITTALRTLDAADQHVDPASPRSRSDLHRILSTDPMPDPLRQPCALAADRAGRPGRAARSARQAALAGVALAAVTAGVVAMPSLTGGDQAFASWTATPEGLTEQERTEAAAGCRRAQQHGAGAEYANDFSSTRPVIAERRGVWTTVVLAGPAGFSAMCISDDSTHLFTKDMIGSIGRPTVHAADGPRELTATSLGTGTMNAGDLSLAAGTAGSEIAAVVYRSSTRGEVAATVSGGHFALWLPGDELTDASSNGVELDVTYRDGSTGTSRLTL